MPDNSIRSAGGQIKPVDPKKIKTGNITGIVKVDIPDNLYAELNKFFNEFSLRQEMLNLIGKVSDIQNISKSDAAMRERSIVNGFLSAALRNPVSNGEKLLKDLFKIEYLRKIFFNNILSNYENMASLLISRAKEINAGRAVLTKHGIGVSVDWVKTKEIYEHSIVPGKTGEKEIKIPAETNEEPLILQQLRSKTEELMAKKAEAKTRVEAAKAAEEEKSALFKEKEAKIALMVINSIKMREEIKDSGGFFFEIRKKMECFFSKWFPNGEHARQIKAARAAEQETQIEIRAAVSEAARAAKERDFAVTWLGSELKTKAGFDKLSEKKFADELIAELSAKEEALRQKAENIRGKITDLQKEAVEIRSSLNDSVNKLIEAGVAIKEVHEVPVHEKFPENFKARAKELEGLLKRGSFFGDGITESEKAMKESWYDYIRIGRKIPKAVKEYMDICNEITELRLAYCSKMALVDHKELEISALERKIYPVEDDIRVIKDYIAEKEKIKEAAKNKLREKAIRKKIALKRKGKIKRTPVQRTEDAVKFGSRLSVEKNGEGLYDNAGRTLREVKNTGLSKKIKKSGALKKLKGGRAGKKFAPEHLTQKARALKKVERLRLRRLGL